MLSNVISFLPYSIETQYININLFPPTIMFTKLALLCFGLIVLSVFIKTAKSPLFVGGYYLKKSS